MATKPLPPESATNVALVQEGLAAHPLVAISSEEHVEMPLSYNERNTEVCQCRLPDSSSDSLHIYLDLQPASKLDTFQWHRGDLFQKRRRIRGDKVQ